MSQILYTQFTLFQIWQPTTFFHKSLKLHTFSQNHLMYIHIVTPRFPVRPDWRIRTGFRGARPNWDSLPDFFFQGQTYTCGYGPHLITKSKYHIHIKITTTGVVSIKIYTHLSSPIYKYKTVLLHLQIRARNLHVVNPYKCVGPAICGCFQTYSPVPTRIKNPC